MPTLSMRKTAFSSGHAIQAVKVQNVLCTATLRKVVEKEGEAIADGTSKLGGNRKVSEWPEDDVISASQF